MFLLSFVVVALSRLYWLGDRQAEVNPEDPQLWNHEMEWLEYVILSVGGDREVEELRWFLDDLGFRPVESRGHVLYLDYIYLGGQAVPVPWRSRVVERLRLRNKDLVPGAECGHCGVVLRPDCGRFVCGCLPGA